MGVSLRQKFSVAKFVAKKNFGCKSCCNEKLFLQKSLQQKNFAAGNKNYHARIFATKCLRQTILVAQMLATKSFCCNDDFCCQAAGKKFCCSDSYKLQQQFFAAAGFATRNFCCRDLLSWQLHLRATKFLQQKIFVAGITFVACNKNFYLQIFLQ